MSDFNIRADSVNVEQIMQQIRARIREKRGVDYTEQQIRELASVKLERFLDPQKVRSELLQQFREGGIAPVPNYAFEDSTLFETHRSLLRWIRRLLNPFLKLLFNPNPLIHVLHLQADINTRHTQYTELSYELLHNLVLETTRLGIEVKNLKMRVESLSSRFDFAERRARALEGVVQYRPGEGPEPEGRVTTAGQPAREETGQPGTGEQRRRRRRRRGRRGGGPHPAGEEQRPAGTAGETPPVAEVPGPAPGGPPDTGPEPAPGPSEPADSGREEQ
jgi:hypothetical protein